MCLDWNSCQEKMQPPHAGVWKVCQYTHLSDAVRWISFEILPSRSATLPTADFSCFLFERPGTSKQQMSTYSPLDDTWESNLAQWSLGCINESSANQRRFFIIQTVAEVSLKVFFLQKKPCHSAAISRAKSPCEILEEKIWKGRTMDFFILNPMSPHFLARLVWKGCISTTTKDKNPTFGIHLEFSEFGASRAQGALGRAQRWWLENLWVVDVSGGMSWLYSVIMCYHEWFFR